MAAQKNRRQQFNDTIDQGEDLDDTPVEIPAGAARPAKSIDQQIQEQIAIQIAKKRPGD